MRAPRIGFSLVVIGCLAGPHAAGVEGQSSVPAIGELRLLIVDPANEQLLRELQCEGWLEANGQTVRRDQYPRLAEAIGRAWTRHDTPRNELALPNLGAERTDEHDSGSSVLGADAVRGGRVIPRRTVRLRYWIYTGTPATHVARTASDAIDSCRSIQPTRRGRD